MNKRNSFVPFFVALFLLYLFWTVPPLFWGTQKIPDLKQYNLHPDEKTHLAAIGKRNFLQGHWDGAGYYNFVKLINFVSEKSFLSKGLKNLFPIQENGPILLIGRFLNALLVFVSGILIFRLLVQFTGSKLFSALGMFFYLTFPAIQVAGHYIRPHVFLNFFLLLFIQCLTRYFGTEDRETKLKNIRRMFLLSGILFSFRYPFAFVIVFPVYFLWKLQERKRIVLDSFLALLAAFAVNPFFFIHLRTSMAMMAAAPYSAKLHALKSTNSIRDFFGVLSPMYELKQIFGHILPNSLGGMVACIVLLTCIAVHFVMRKKNRALHAYFIFLLYYLITWVMLGQTVLDGLSRFAAPFLLMFALLVPICFAALIEKHPQARIPVLVFGFFLLAQGFLFSSELLHQMSHTDPRLRMLEKVNGGEINFYQGLGWESGIFSEMKDRVRILEDSDLTKHTGESLWFVDVSVIPQNPYEHKPELKLVETITPKKWMGLWSDSCYLHDYRYFSTTIYRYNIQSN